VDGRAAIGVGEPFDYTAPPPAREEKSRSREMAEVRAGNAAAPRLLT